MPQDRGSLWELIADAEGGVFLRSTKSYFGAELNPIERKRLKIS